MNTNTQECNGWTNYETWLVSLWIDNDYGDYLMRNESRPDDGWTGATVCEFVETIYEEQIPVTGLIADLVGAAFSAVDWASIAEHWESDYEDEDEDAA